jgi:integrase
MLCKFTSHTGEEARVPRPKKPWSKVIEEAGISVRLYERAPGSLLYREVRIDGAKDRKSLGHRDRELAEQQGRTLARRVAELQFAGQTGALTFGQLTSLFRLHRLRLLTKTRQRAVNGMLALLERHFPRELVVDDLTQHHADAYVAARKSGALRSPRHRGGRDAHGNEVRAGVAPGTVRNELYLLVAMLTWALTFRQGGRRILTANPLEGMRIPLEKNTKRPIATEERYRQLLAVADQVDSLGRFRCMLVLARATGRRVNAICNLKVSDVALNREQLVHALARAGLDLRHADQWPHGAIVWDARSDKLGYHAVAPISLEARNALDVYLRGRLRVGDTPLFHATNDETRAVHKELAAYWLRSAEKKAKLVHVERGGWHMLRRLWASERRHLAAQDVAAAGGWRSINVMRDAYQQADGKTVLSVVENVTPRVAPIAPDPAAADGSK